MKVLPVHLVMGSFSGALAAQSRLELGVWGGGAGYLGDSSFLLSAPAEVQPAYGLLLRMRQTPAWSFRFRPFMEGFAGMTARRNPITDNGAGISVSKASSANYLLRWSGIPGLFVQEKPMLRSRCFVAPVIVVGVGAMYLKAEPRFGLQDDQPVPQPIQQDLDVKSPLILPE
ncbi:MAG: hypothetical protein IPJ00_21590 [Saprospirales bacterium]|nr:hypothetical protein [Saprospirales bacterium]